MKRFLIFLFLIFSLSSQSFSQEKQISLSATYGYEGRIYSGLKYQTDLGSRGSISILYNLITYDGHTNGNDFIDLSYNYYLSYFSKVSSQGLYISPSILLSADFIKNKKKQFLNHYHPSNYRGVSHSSLEIIEFGPGIKLGYQWIFNGFGLGIETSFYFVSTHKIIYSRHHYKNYDDYIYNSNVWVARFFPTLSLGYLF